MCLAGSIRPNQPRAVVIDGLRSHGAALNEVGNPDRQEVERWLNQEFGWVLAAFHNHLNQERHLTSRETHPRHSSLPD